MIAPANPEQELEEELMVRLIEGDLRAFEALHDRLSNLAFGFAMRVVNDRGTAAEVTQEAFLQLWRYRETYIAARGTPRAWLLGIVRNRAIDAYRGTQSRGGPPRQQPWIRERAAADNTEEEAIDREQALRIRGAIDVLPAKQRTVIDLTYFMGMTQTEVAGQLEVPLGTVKGRTRLALNQLRRSLGHANTSRM